MVIEGQTVSASASDAVHIPCTVTHSAKLPLTFTSKRCKFMWQDEQRFAKGPIVQLHNLKRESNHDYQDVSAIVSGGVSGLGEATTRRLSLLAAPAW